MYAFSRNVFVTTGPAREKMFSTLLYLIKKQKLQTFLVISGMVSLVIEDLLLKS